jgi:hypothetical protein
MGFVSGEIMKKESQAKVILTMGKPGSIIGDGFFPRRNYEEGVQGKGHFHFGKPGSRIIGDGVLSVQKEGVIKMISNMQTWLQDNRGWILSTEKL